MKGGEVIEKAKDLNRERLRNSLKKGGGIMSSDKKVQKGITRRDFFKGAAVAGAVVSGAGALNYAEAKGHHGKGWGYGWQDEGQQL